MLRCSICKREMFGEAFGHNAEPINDGRCCNICNEEVVLPRRIIDIMKSQKNEICPLCECPTWGIAFCANVGCPSGFEPYERKP